MTTFMHGVALGFALGSLFVIVAVEIALRKNGGAR